MNSEHHHKSVDWFNIDPTEQALKVNGSKNCPNCGGVIDSERCPYCGTLFIDFACIDADKPFFMKIKRNGVISIVKVAMIGVSARSEPTYLYADNTPYVMYQSGSTEISLDFIVLP